MIAVKHDDSCEADWGPEGQETPCQCANRAESEECRVCLADKTGDRSVWPDEDIPLCQHHWSLWLARYMSPAEAEPPCSAHVITPDGQEGDRG